MSEAAHAKLSPSSASGWMTCADYVNANAAYVDETSEFAAEGTFAHSISDACLTYDMDPFDFVGHKTTVDGFQFEWSEEDAELLQPGIDWVREQPGTFYGEQRLDLSWLLGPNQFGTTDRCIVSEIALVSSDLKWGRGVPVSPVRHKQQMLYALAAWKKFAPHIADRNFPVVINVDQPRCSGGGGTWRTTLGDLFDFAEEARAAAERTRQPNPTRTASQAGCLWCKAKNDCPTFADFNLRLLGIDDFDDLDDGKLVTPEPALISPERRAVILQHRSMIDKFLDHLHASCLADALSGAPTGGLKAVAGRKSPDKWSDKDAAEAELHRLIGDRAYAPRKIITPAQARKSISAEDTGELRKLIVEGERKPSLVDEADDRPALPPIGNPDDFDDLDSL